MAMLQLRRSITFILLIASSCFAEDFTITVKRVGIGNEWRAGEVTPIQVDVTTSLLEAQAAWIQWEVLDADGDLVLWGRPVTLTPNATTSVWLYAPIRAWETNSTVWTLRLRAFEGNEPTHTLHTFRFSPQTTGAMNVENTQGLIAVFGASRMGLQGYLPIAQFEPKHDGVKIVSGLTSTDLPDQWIALQSLDALVWSDAEPILQSKQKRALLDWIYRGGHFVIVLPAIGNPWSLNTAQNAIPELLNHIQPTSGLASMRELDGIVGRQFRWPSFQMPIKSFGYDYQDWGDDTPLLTLDDGRVVAFQRNYGFGAISIIGIDLTSGRLASIGLPEPDVLWNRILGKRTDTPSPQTVQLLKDAKRLSNTIPTYTDLSVGNVAANLISMSTTAAGRLGTVFILIVLYWLIGGPIGYFVLYKKNLVRWSWVAFTCVAVVFTFATLLFASNSTSIKVKLKHLTVVDHVYGAVGQRVTGWFSLYLPSFGIDEVTLGGEENNVLLPWTPPDASMTPPFIDQQEVLVDISRPPNSFNQPSRATTANFSYKWLGGVEGSYYNSLLRVTNGSEPVVVFDTQGNANSLDGSITNNASHALNDVTVIWITNEVIERPPLHQIPSEGVQPWVNPQQSGKPLNKAYTWRIKNLPSKDMLDLTSLKTSNDATFTLAMASRYAYERESRFGRSYSQSDVQKYLEMLSLYSHLQPPTYQKDPTKKQGPKSHVTTRDGGRDLDLSHWFSRPCIIVMGFFNNAPIPVPISVDGVPNRTSEGVTFVRWIYPLD